MKVQRVYDGPTRTSELRMELQARVHRRIEGGGHYKQSTDINCSKVLSLESIGPNCPS